MNDDSPNFDHGDSYENVVGPTGELVYSLSAQSAAAYGDLFAVDDATDVFVKELID